jgi:hypothetical protein
MPMLNETSRCEDVCGNREVARRILILFLDVKFLHQSDRRLGCSKCWSERTVGSRELIVRLCLSHYKDND